MNSYQRMPLHWFEMKKGERGVNQRHYVEVMDTVVWPWIEETYGDKDIVYCFQQVCSKCLFCVMQLRS